MMILTMPVKMLILMMSLMMVMNLEYAGIKFAKQLRDKLVSGHIRIGRQGTNLSSFLRFARPSSLSSSSSDKYIWHDLRKVLLKTQKYSLQKMRLTGSKNYMQQNHHHMNAWIFQVFRALIRHCSPHPPQHPPPYLMMFGIFEIANF